MQTTKTNWHRLRREILRHWQLYLLLLLPITYLIIFKYVPMYGAQLYLPQGQRQ